MTLHNEKGVLYFACNHRKYINQAIDSITSLKQHSPHIRSCMVTNLDIPKSESPFDFVRTIACTDHPYIERIQALHASPFERTLYLDTDTLIVGDIENIFSLLEKHDLGYTKYVKKTKANCGVLLYKKSEVIKTFFETYAQQLRDLSDTHFDDEAIFDRVRRQKDISIVDFGETYNFRTRTSKPIPSNKDIKILHGNEDSLYKAFEIFQNRS